MHGSNDRCSDRVDEADRGGRAAQPPRPADAVAELYADLAAQVRQIVRSSIRAPEAVVDDACQVAWSRLLRRWGSVRADAALPWLVRTASRAALRSIQHTERELSLDQLCDAGQDPSAAVVLPAAPDEIAQLRARLDELRALPERQQQLVWMQALGFTYVEMADHTRATRRTVERQLMRAKRSLRAA